MNRLTTAELARLFENNLRYQDFWSLHFTFDELALPSHWLVASKANVYCPFHRDEHHPSATIYVEEEGESLWCFVEQRIYRPYDYFTLILQREDHFSALIRKRNGTDSLMSDFDVFAENWVQASEREEFDIAWPDHRQRGKIGVARLMESVYPALITNLRGKS